MMKRLVNKFDIEIEIEIETYRERDIYSIDGYPGFEIIYAAQSQVDCAHR
jgi:hypothetical protein